MLLGKRPRPPMKRTTSMTEFTLDLNASAGAGSVQTSQAVAAVDQHLTGDSAFCSLECRQQQMTQDERKEKCSLVASKKEAMAAADLRRGRHRIGSRRGHRREHRRPTSSPTCPAAQTPSPPHPLLRLHRCSRCNSVTVPPPLCRPQQSLVNRGRRPKQRPRSSPLQPLVAVAIAPRYFSSKSLLSYFSSPSMYLLQDTIRNIPGWRSAVMDLDAKRWPDAQTDDTLSFSKLVRLSFSGFIKGIEESETMVYFVDGSSFRKKGFGSRKPAMAVPDLLKEVGGERCSAFQHQPVGDEERSDFRVGDLRESCDVREVRRGGRAACVKPRGEKPRTALCLCLLCLSWTGIILRLREHVPRGLFVREIRKPFGSGFGWHAALVILHGFFLGLLRRSRLGLLGVEALVLSQALADGLQLGVDVGVERLVLAEVAADEGAVVAEVRKVEPSRIASELIRRLVVSQRRLLSRIKRPQPESGPVLGQTDLSHPFPPVALPHPSSFSVRAEGDSGDFTEQVDLLAGDIVGLGVEYVHEIGWFSHGQELPIWTELDCTDCAHSSIENGQRS
nr:FCS-Like Zinc finger 6-like [Ipomoea batatas]